MSTRAAILARRTYCRLKDDGAYESWFETIDRTIRHQAWLWARARGQVEGSAGNAESVFHDPTPDAVVDAGRVLDDEACEELRELRGLMRDRAALLAGRYLRSLKASQSPIHHMTDCSQYLSCSQRYSRKLWIFV